MDIQTEPLTEAIKKEIYEGFADHSIEAVGTSDLETPISFQIKDENQKIISAIVVQHFWGALHMKYVWTAKEQRGKGYAKVLMQKVLNYAKEQNYPFIFVETLSFQAPEFYKKFGFEVEFERKGYSHNSSFLYLIHRLNR